MSLIDLTHESLGRMIGQEIPESYVLIAKNSVMGLAGPAIAELLGVTPEEILEIESDELYRHARLIVAAHYNSDQVEVDLSWDALESKALAKLLKRVDYEQDVDTNLRIATMANRAQRRTTLPQNRPLDASRAGETVQLTLTKRVIERFSDRGSEVETTQQLSVRDGGASNLTFEDLDRHLGVSARPRIPANLSFRTSEPNLDARKLEEFMNQSIKK